MRRLNTHATLEIASCSDSAIGVYLQARPYHAAIGQHYFDISYSLLFIYSYHDSRLRAIAPKAEYCDAMPPRRLYERSAGPLQKFSPARHIIAAFSRQLAGATRRRFQRRTAERHLRFYRGAQAHMLRGLSWFSATFHY